MNPRTVLPLALVSALLLAGPAAAQSAADVAGVWKRLGKTERFFVLEAGEDGSITGRLTNPPFASMACSLELKLEGDKLTGTAEWTEKVDGKEYQEGTKWEFTFKGDEIKGRAEVIDWEGGVVYSREWADYTLVRVERKGLVTQGEAEEAFGDDLPALGTFAGGWLGAGGPWAAALEGEELVLTAVGHHDGAVLRLKDDRGTLRGEVKVDGVTSKVELGFNEGALSGRSSWIAGTLEGWAPVSFTRLDRTEAAADAGEATKPESSEGPLNGVWKRDDGLYLRVREQGGKVSGVLSAADGKPLCRLTFAQKGGIWVGLANWGSYETTWELGVAGDELRGRCEWSDLHEGKLVARGWGGRSFSRLGRLN